MRSGIHGAIALHCERCVMPNPPTQPAPLTSAAQAVIDAWNSNPGLATFTPAALEWLMKTMAPAIDQLRKELK